MMQVHAYWYESLGLEAFLRDFLPAKISRYMVILSRLTSTHGSKCPTLKYMHVLIIISVARLGSPDHMHLSVRDSPEYQSYFCALLPECGKDQETWLGVPNSFSQTSVRSEHETKHLEGPYTYLLQTPSCVVCNSIAKLQSKWRHSKKEQGVLAWQWLRYLLVPQLKSKMQRGTIRACSKWNVSSLHSFWLGLLFSLSQILLQWPIG